MYFYSNHLINYTIDGNSCNNLPLINKSLPLYCRFYWLIRDSWTKKDVKSKLSGCVMPKCLGHSKLPSNRDNRR